MYRVTSINIKDGTLNQVTTQSRYYAEERYKSYKVAESCGYVKDVIMREISLDEIKAEAEKESEKGWITPSAQLPEENSRVLVSIKTSVKIVKSGFYESGIFYTDDGDSFEYRDKELKAWRYCPLPYRRG